MKKALMTVGLIAGVAVASAIDISVLLGLLPVGAAACVSLAIVIIFTATNPKTSPSRGFVCTGAAPASRAAEKGEMYVITGKSIHNNPGKFK